MTVTVTDSRGRTASATRTVTVLDYSPPSLSLFTAERCNADGTAAQTDGTKVRISAKASGSSVGACTVYYRLSRAESWVSAVTLTPSDCVITEANRLLSPTFDALSSYYQERLPLRQKYRGHADRHPQAEGARRGGLF